MSTISAGNTTTTTLTQTGDTSGNLSLVAVGGIIDANACTAGFIVPVGTTAQRPGTALNGTVRYNTTNSKLEVYVNNAWANVTTV